MKILKSAIVSNSDIIKNYKTHRDRAESLGKIFVFKNNQLDAVLFSISEYERVSDILEAIETCNDADLATILGFIQKKKLESILHIESGIAPKL
jgi:PHD/YefM family antitoxin component YafN of YafNO toxin-antitoxin module